jgi:hypothetical protein
VSIALKHLGAAVAALAISCGSRTTGTSTPQPKPAEERFVDVLQHGGVLYGVDTSCTEWRATIGNHELVLEAGAETDEDGDSADPDAATDAAPEDEGSDPSAGSDSSAEPDPAVFRGYLKAQAPDGEGRIFGFSYYATSLKRPLRLRFAGRGGWSPAPGVVFRDPKTGYVLIGTGRYCVEDVEVQPEPAWQDGVRVGDETWFLSHDACLHARHAAALAWQGCSAGKKAR